MKSLLKTLLAKFGLRILRSDFYRPPASCQVPALGKIYEALFGRSASGFFVEVGAFDGETYSNSCFLADMGWRGMYVEPVREFADRCRARHRRNDVTVYDCAAGASDSTIEIVVQGEYTRGADATSVEALARGVHRKVPVRTLDELLREAGAPRKFDLLIIDTEGSELEVLRGLELSRWSPRAIMVETNFVSREKDDEVRAHLERSGYVLIYRDMVNSILVDAGCLDEVRGRSA